MLSWWHNHMNHMKFWIAVMSWRPFQGGTPPRVQILAKPAAECSMTFKSVESSSCRRQNITTAKISLTIAARVCVCLPACLWVHPPWGHDDAAWKERVLCLPLIFLIISTAFIQIPLVESCVPSMLVGRNTVAPLYPVKIGNKASLSQFFLIFHCSFKISCSCLELADCGICFGWTLRAR